MTRDDGEGFLSRWSRRKTEERQAEANTPEPKAAPPAAMPDAPAKESSPASAAAEPELPSVDTLKGLASEYTEFLKPGVDESLRRSALKKLFSDPYFETFERFEAYCEDYTQGEAIPAAMLKTLEHAKRLLFDETQEGQSDVAGNGKADAPLEPEAKPEAPAAPPQPEEKT